MTANQLAYWANKEQARSNRAREVETKRHNIARLAQERDQFNRSNWHTAVRNVSGVLRLFT